MMEVLAFRLGAFFAHNSHLPIAIFRQRPKSVGN